MASSLAEVAQRLQAHAATRPTKPEPETVPEHERLGKLYERGVITEDEYKQSLGELSMSYEEAQSLKPKPVSTEVAERIAESRRRTARGRKYATLYKWGLLSERMTNRLLARHNRTLASYL